MELKAGPELDAAVAEAIGKHVVRITHRGVSEVAVQDGPMQGEHTLWRPSINVNAAFEAAEKVGLFDQCLGLLDFRGDPKIWRCHASGDVLDVVGEGSTPALAICAAILKLKGK